MTKKEQIDNVLAPLAAILQDFLIYCVDNLLNDYLQAVRGSNVYAFVE